MHNDAAGWGPQPQRDQGAQRRQPAQTAQPMVIPRRDSSFGQNTMYPDLRTMPVENRPPWQGASGRERQITPMRDDPTVAPLSLPAKGGKKGGFKGEGQFRARLSHIGGAEGTSSAGAAMRKLISRTHKKANSVATPSPRVQYNMDSAQAVAAPYPSPPHRDSSRMAASPSPQNAPGQSVTIKRKPPPSAHIHSSSVHAHPLASSPVNEDEIPKPPTPESPSAAHTSRLAVGDAWTQPPSRFSMTTFATTISTPNANATSIENSPAVGMESPAQSIATRGGPVLKADHVRSVSEAPFMTRGAFTARSESPASDNGAKSIHGRAENASAGPRRASIGSMSKPLPPAPPEVSASDRVAHLNAQLEGLANRRLNINRCIKQMTELIPIDNLMASTAVQKKREMERQKVEALRTELAEIQREEHELGLMLHRAYKRQNKEAEYEPTTLWVRRVAG